MVLDEFNQLQIEEDQTNGGESTLIAKGKGRGKKRVQNVSVASAGAGKSEVEC